MPSPYEQALQDLRISGSIMLHETYAAPWAISIPDEADLRRLAGVGPEVRVLPFHFVRDGTFLLRPQGGPETLVSKHEVAICPGGQPHVMGLGGHRHAVAFADILNGAAPSQAPSAVPATSLLCGLFFLKGAPLNPLFAALPPVVKLDTQAGTQNPLLAQSIAMLSHEVARGNSNSFSTLRLLELFCAEAFLAYRMREGTRSANWFKALDDTKIAPALAEIHRNPGAEISVANLAAHCGMSASRFAARFREAMGCSVMSYVADWRMNIACRLLGETDRGLAEIAQQVGYSDVAAFSRAFKAGVGESPAQWRRAMR